MVDISDDSMIAGGAGVHDSGEGRYVPCDVAKQFVEIIIPKVLQR